MIFLSYCWAQSDYADKVERYLQEHHLAVLRDKKDLKKTDCLSEFMDKLGTSDYAILLISEAYMKSYNCLNEALIAYKNRGKRNIIPIVFQDANLFTPIGQLKYIAFWENKRNELSELTKSLPAQKTIAVNRQIRQIEVYTSFLGDFLAYIQDTNCILLNDGEDSLEQIYRCLCRKILSREIRTRKINAGAVMPAQARYGPVPSDILLSIDFGTSYTLLSVVDDQGVVHLIPDCDGKVIHSSSIEFTDSGDYLVGTESPLSIRHIKRLIGVRDSIFIGNQQLSITLLVAMILKSMIRNAEDFLGVEIHHVIMALPTDFTLAQKNILNESARLAGVNVCRFLHESSAESLLIVPSDHDDYYAAFIDMGGGTLDITLANVGDGICDTIYSDGDSCFGSLDFDAELEHLLAHKLLIEHGIDAKNLGFLAEQVKCQFGNQQSVTVSYLHRKKSGDIQIIPLMVTRSEFETATEKLIRKFITKLVLLRSQLFENSTGELTSPKLKIIYLTGQGTKLLILKEIIKTVFPESEIVDKYQESALINALSIQNKIFTGNEKKQLLLDAIPSSVVVKCCKYREREISILSHEQQDTAILSLKSNPQDGVLLEQNTTLPTRRTIALEFDTLEEKNSLFSYPLEIYEVTISGRRSLLISTRFTPKSGLNYSLRIDIDPNYEIVIRLTEESPTCPHQDTILQEFYF